MESQVPKFYHSMADVVKQKQLIKMKLNNEMHIRGERIFTDPSEYVYKYQSHIPSKGQPQFIDVIDATSLVYKTCYQKMLRRMAMYPYLSYVFLTSSSQQEISDLFAMCPCFEDIVNVIDYSKTMRNIINFKDIPSCFLVNQNNTIIYEGNINVDKICRKISYLNELAHRQYPMHKRISTHKQALSIKNDQLSLALSGLCSSYNFQQKQVKEFPLSRPQSAISQKLKPDNDTASEITSIQYQASQQQSEAKDDKKLNISKQRPQSAQHKRTINLADSVQPFQQLLQSQQYSTFQIGRNAAIKKQADTILQQKRPFVAYFIDGVIDNFE